VHPCAGPVGIVGVGAAMELRSAARERIVEHRQGCSGGRARRAAVHRSWQPNGPRVASTVPTYDVPLPDRNIMLSSVSKGGAPSGSRFANINRPVAGPTHEKELPVGKHPLQLYSLATPNGAKVTIMLEELLALGFEGAEYDAHLIRINEGDQFSSGFVAVNPNSKIPAMVDRSVDPPVRIFESGSILLYLAEKFGAFLPKDLHGRTECLNWLFWQMGSAPYVGGGFGHFYVYAPEKYEYPINRFTMETKRQLDVLDRRLAEVAYIAGEEDRKSVV